MTDVLTISGVSRTFGAQTAVDNVSLSIKAGECIALVGHNGAGKTTLFKMMLGLIACDSGSISVLGHPPGQADNIGFLPESIAFQKALTGLELLSFFGKLRGSKMDPAEALSRVGLDDAMHKRVGAYSKGMRQRLGLAQALMGNPALLVLDEPTTGLDPASRRRFYRLLDSLRQTGTTILLSSHSLSEIETHTSRVVIMSRGRVLADGPMEELTRDVGLPVRVDVRTNGITPADLIQTFKSIDYELVNPATNENWVTMNVRATDKMALLRQISVLDSIDDIRITPATLEELYAHYHDGNADPMRIRARSNVGETKSEKTDLPEKADLPEKTDRKEAAE